MNLKYTIVILFLLVWLPVFLFSQNNLASHSITCDVPEVALLSLVSEGEKSMNISLITPTEAGNSIDGFNTEQNKIWINYSSIIRNKNHKRKIVAVLESNVPEGVQILVEVSEPIGAGKGKFGFSSGLIALSNQPNEIINDIGSCYTGKGVNNGHFLTYKLKFDKTSDNYSQLTESETSVNVIYTLTDTY